MSKAETTLEESVFLGKDHPFVGFSYIPYFKMAALAFAIGCGFSLSPALRYLPYVATLDFVGQVWVPIYMVCAIPAILLAFFGGGIILVLLPLLLFSIVFGILRRNWARSRQLLRVVRSTSLCVFVWIPILVASPVYQYLWETNAQQLANDAVEVENAIQAYYSTNESYPESLEDLAPAILDGLPSPRLAGFKYRYVTEKSGDEVETYVLWIPMIGFKRFIRSEELCQDTEETYTTDMGTWCVCK